MNMKKTKIKVYYNYSENHQKKENNLNIYLKSELVKDSYVWRLLTNTFIIFKSINNLLFLIYSTKDKSIICYDINKEKKVSEIKNAHKDYCISLRHYLDTINKRDIIISLFDINTLKLWDARNFECIINLSIVYKEGQMLSAYLLKDNNINYIITSNFLDREQKSEPIKIFDLSGNLIKEIKDLNESTAKMHNYYDHNFSKNYIITSNYNHVTSYDYNLNKIYHTYFDVKNSKLHSDVIIKCEESIIKLIESCNDGYIRIWNFHSGLMLNKINLVNYKNQYCLCL